jgi:very-short-patch-repair endonuclease
MDNIRYCIDCCKILDFKSTTGRCKSCQAKHRWAQPGFKERTGASVSAAQKKFHAEHPEAGAAHSVRMKKHYEDPENRERLVGTLREYWKDPENRKAQSKRVLQYHEEHPEAAEVFKERIDNYFSTNPGARERCTKVLIDYYEANPKARSEIMKRVYAENPELAELQRNHLARMREEFWADPENHIKASEFWTEYCNDPVNRKHNSETSKALWKDPTYAEPAREHIYTVLIPAFEEWIDLPGSRELKAKNASEQLARGFYQPSSLECMVQEFFDTNNINYIQQYRPEGYNRVYDFLLPDAMPPLLIEVDGTYWHSSPGALARGASEIDAAKDTWAIGNGFDMLRIPEQDLLKIGVEAFILDARPEILVEFF